MPPDLEGIAALMMGPALMLCYQQGYTGAAATSQPLSTASQVRDGARPAVDGCTLSGNGEWGLRLQDAGGTYNGNVVSANAKGSVAYTLLDDEVRRSCAQCYLVLERKGQNCRPLRCPLLCCFTRCCKTLQLAWQSRAALTAHDPASNKGPTPWLLQVDTAMMVVYNKLDRPVQSVGKM